MKTSQQENKYDWFQHYILAILIKRHLNLKSDDCKKFGNPYQGDVIDVWGAENPIEKVDDHYDQFKKLIWPNQQAMRVNSQKLEKPLTALYLVFVRILENCRDQLKLILGPISMNWKSHSKYSFEFRV